MLFWSLLRWMESTGLSSSPVELIPNNNCHKRLIELVWQLCWLPWFLCVPPLTRKGFHLHFKHTLTHTLRLVFIMSLSSKWELTHSFQGKSLLRNYKSLTNFSAKFRIFGIIDILSAAQSDNRSVICYIVLFPLLQTQVGIERWLRVRHFRVGMMINDHLISH